MNRRAFIAAVGGAAAWPVVARGQKRNPNVGVLNNGRTDLLQAAFQQGLTDFGYVVGQNITLTWRDAAENTDRLNQFAAELVAAKMDVLFGSSSQMTSALSRQTNRIPIVTISSNPVGLGFAASLAQPGGNITGLSLLGPEVAGKRIELLKEIIPDAATAAVFWNPDERGARFSLAETQAASTSLALNLRVFETRDVADLDSAFSGATKEGDQAVILLPAPFMGRNAGRIAELALRNRLPTFGFIKEEAKAGELVAFGPNILAAMRRAAYFVDRILKGASPSDLPIEQPTKFELVINQKTAKALGLEIPPMLLARADEVIE
jgi:putative tryptophan/tyrosine transport system substrate-binding protein